MKWIMLTSHYGSDWGPKLPEKKGHQRHDNWRESTFRHASSSPERGEAL